MRAAALGMVVGGALGCSSGIAPSVDSGGGGNGGGGNNGGTVDDYPKGVRFALEYGYERVACGEPIQLVGLATDTIRITDMRMFVSDLVLSGPDGEADLVLDQDSDFQYANIALLDFEDGCDPEAGGTAEVNRRVLGNIPEGTWDTLEFTLGLPFDRNHPEGLPPQPPLDESSMWLNAQRGYRFLKLGIRVDTEVPPRDRYPYELRSSGCESPNSNTPPVAACARPNRPRYSLPFDPFGDQIVVLDLEILLGGTNLSVNAEASPPGCTADAADTSDCAAGYAALGLAIGTGACSGPDGLCTSQTAFRVETSRDEE